MNRITAVMLSDFCRENHLTALKTDKQFEHFTAHLVLSRFLPDSFDTADVVLGSSGDNALDAIAIIVNGALVTSVEEVADLAARNGYLDATFVFIQADHGPSFHSPKMGEVQLGVEHFFNEESTLPRSPAVKNAVEIQAAIYERANLFSQGNPKCRIFYATTGTWTGDAHLQTRRESIVESLVETRIFRDVEFAPLGADDLQKLYHQSRNAISRRFTFKEKSLMPETAGVSQAWLGLLPASEFIPLITDESGYLVHSVFYENVRDWLGDNDVNKGIQATLADAGTRSRFALMNNGVTIIAKTLQATGNTFIIQDYQVVNGCQTSHVLYNQRATLDPTVMIPLRVIATTDDDVVASIIRATNRQTQVKEEQFFALSDFSKKLELFFQSFDDGKKLYFERRPRQYNAASVEKARIITQDNLLRAYVSVFREEPQNATRRFSEVKKEIGKNILKDTDRPDPYYVSALALYQLDALYRSESLELKYKSLRYQTLMVFRLLTEPGRVPPSNSHEMERLCKRLMDLLWEPAKCKESLIRAASITEEVAGGNFSHDSLRTVEFTTKLKKRCDELAPSSSS